VQRKKLSGCQPDKTVKTFLFVLAAVMVFSSCDKPIESDYQIVDLKIVQTTTPATAALNQNIISSVKVMGSDLCYHFSYFTVNHQQFLIDVHAKGTYPAKPTACPLALYYADTTLSIPTTTTGQYILRFYNGIQLFKSDTVQVN
jgi:hypothetical protein